MIEASRGARVWREAARQLPIRRATLDSESGLLGAAASWWWRPRIERTRIRSAPGHFSAAILLADY